MSYADYTPPVGFLANDAVDPRSIRFFDSLADLEADLGGGTIPRGQHVLILSSPGDERNTIKVLLRAKSGNPSTVGGDLPRVVFCDRRRYDEMQEETAAPPPNAFGKRSAPGRKPAQAPAITFCTPPLLVSTALIGPAGNMRPDMNGKPKYVLSMNGKPWCATQAREAAVAGTDTSVLFNDFAVALDRLEDWLVYAMMHSFTRTTHAVAAAGRIAEFMKTCIRDFSRLNPSDADPLADVAHWLRRPEEYMRSTKSFADDIARCKALAVDFRKVDDTASVFSQQIPAFIIRAAIDSLRRDTARIFHGLLLPPDEKNPTRSILMTRLLFQNCYNRSDYERQYAEFKDSINSRVESAARVSPAHAQFMAEQLATVDDVYRVPAQYYFSPPTINRTARLNTGDIGLVPSAPPTRNSVAVARFQINASSVSGRCDIGMQACSVTVTYPSTAIDPEYHIQSDSSYSGGTVRVSAVDAGMFNNIDLSDSFEPAGSDDAGKPPYAKRVRAEPVAGVPPPPKRSQFEREIVEGDELPAGASYRPATGGTRGAFMIPSADE